MSSGQANALAFGCYLAGVAIAFGLVPEEDCSLGQLLVRGSGPAFHEYEFGDNWLHRIELVSCRAADEATVPARLTGGDRRGPLEDSGGLPGYESILDTLADPA